MAARAWRQMLPAEHNQNRKLELRAYENSVAVGAHTGSSSSGDGGYVKSLILGTRLTRTSTMVPPAFETWLTAMLKERADKQKADRKHREEMEALKALAEKK